MVVAKREFVIPSLSYCSSSFFWKRLRRLLKRESNLHYTRRIRLRYKLLRLYILLRGPREKRRIDFSYLL